VYQADPDAWRVRPGGAARHSPAGALHALGAVAADFDPLRRSVWAPTTDDRENDPLGGTPIPPEVLGELRRSTGGGRTLPSDVAASAGTALGTDVSGVRLHTDGTADRLARSVQSEAFTHGRDIYFTHGRYAPTGADGSRLLAHELAHVAQHDSGGAGTIGRAGDPAESAADRVADRVAPALRRSLAGEPGGNPRAARAAAGGSQAAAFVGDHRADEGDLHRTVLRRRISATSADIAASRGKKKGMAKLTGAKDSLDKIGKLLDRHAKLSDQQAQVASLTAIAALVDRWLTSHTGPKDRAVIAVLEDVKAEVRRDLGQALAQQRYVNDFRAGELTDERRRLPHQPTATPFTQQLFPSMAFKASGAMSMARQTPGGQGYDAPVAEVIRAAGLTEAEVGAIKLFTVQDFLYINPAVANNAGWLAGQMDNISGLVAAQEANTGPRTADPTKLREEGLTHAGVMMQGLAKLEPKKGKVYRGARMSLTEFEDTYVTKPQVTYASFTSSAVEPRPAEWYAEGGGAKTPRADQTVSVTCVLEVDDARDIRPLSEVAVEQEWLLLPGATFAVTRIEDKTGGAPGTPPATAWKVVHLKQIKGGSVGPADTAPKAAAAPDLSSPAAQALAKLGRGDFSASAPGESAAQKMQRLGRGDFSTPAPRRRRP
jgi:hypothetical protein